GALADGDGDALLAEVEALAEFSPDWDAVLEAVAEALHRIQVRQLVPGAGEADDNVEALAGRMRPEVVQLWYQMALAGRRDLSHAPGPRTGFEMSLLRMLAFRPSETAGEDTPTAAPTAAPASKPASRARGGAAAAARAA